MADSPNSDGATKPEPASPSGDEPASPSGEKQAPSRARRILRYALRGSLVLLVALIGLWLAAHRWPAVGSTVADGLRAVLGPDAVTSLEDFAYGVEDRWNQLWRSDEKPKAYWKVPAEVPAPPPQPAAEPTGDPEADAGPRLPPFHPADVGPVYDHMAAEGDGVWIPVPAAGGPTVMYKTLLHPDRKRPWAELFVVALDLRQLAIEFELGTVEPKATTVEGRKVERPGLIPTDARDALVAGFNGGFKLQHGRWGAGMGETEIVNPRVHGCTVAKTREGELLVDRWPDVKDDQPELVWWRQTPPCMFHDGERHGALWDPEAKGWGATLEGGTVIRRSAIGLTEDREMLLVGVSNHTAAHVLADGMHHAGAVDVAQLDVNWSYPRFVVFPTEDAERKTRSLFEGFEVDEDEYLSKPSIRDFFYVIRKPDGDSST